MSKLFSFMGHAFGIKTLFLALDPEDSILIFFLKFVKFYVLHFIVWSISSLFLYNV